MTHNTEEPTHEMQNSCPRHEYTISAKYIQGDQKVSVNLKITIQEVGASYVTD